MKHLQSQTNHIIPYGSVWMHRIGVWNWNWADSAVWGGQGIEVRNCQPIPSLARTRGEPPLPNSELTGSESLGIGHPAADKAGLEEHAAAALTVSFPCLPARSPHPLAFILRRPPPRSRPQARSQHQPPLSPSSPLTLDRGRAAASSPACREPPPPRLRAVSCHLLAC